MREAINRETATIRGNTVSENVKSLCEREIGKSHTLPLVKRAGLNSSNVYMNHQKHKKSSGDTRELELEVEIPLYLVDSNPIGCMQKCDY